MVKTGGYEFFFGNFRGVRNKFPISEKILQAGPGINKVQPLNDLHKAIKYSVPHLFADDTNILVIGSSIKQI